MKTKIFCDTADYNIIKKYSKYKIVEGFTTNPSLMRKVGAKNYKYYSLKILKICRNKPISFEVFSDDIDQMIIQANKINSWSKNVYVKIPVINSKGKFTGKVIKKLSSNGIKLNITAVYSFQQVSKIYKSLDKRTKAIISIFAGRMTDTGIDPTEIFKKSIQLTKKNKSIMILWASTREAYNYLQAKKLGCEIITMPPKIIDQIKKFGKTSSYLSLDTVKKFLVDSKKARFKI